MTRRVLPRVSLGTFPTPVEPLRVQGLAADLFVKRDETTSAVYGGNKIRKLELFFADARAKGRRRILTLGAVGSHQVVATSILGAREGFEVEAVLVPQPWSRHAEENVRLALAHGLRAHPAAAWTLAPLAVARHRTREHYVVPLGGSNPLGTLAYVDAAHELAEQVARGDVPEPDVVVVALGSGGTAAGLAVGFAALRMKTRVLGVAVSHPTPILAFASRRLARRAAELAGLPPAIGRDASRRLEIASRFVGRGYGWPTRDGQAAIVDAAAAGLVVDPTYTAKAFACALKVARAGDARVVLYWHTLGGASDEARAVVRSGDDLDPRIARLLT